MWVKMDEVLASFMEWTAWGMERPPSYGAFHLIWTAVALLVCVIFAWKLRNVSEKANRWILLSIGIFLILCELYKQLFYYYHIGSRSYQWWIFPFQLCSVPMYLCIIAPLLRPGKLQRGMYHFMLTFNLLGGIAALAEPSGLTHEYWTLTLHAFIWHSLLIFIGLYLGFSHRTKARWQDYTLACLTFLGLAAIAFGINLALQNVSEGTINMFFVGPKNSSLVVFKDISEHYGWYISTLLYLPTVCIGALAVFLPFHLAKKNQCGNP